jgi:type I restriction enzyme S subunit
MASINSLSSYYEKFLATGEVKCIDEEIPFEIPRGWEWCRFGSLSFNRDSERIPLSVSERLKLNKKFDYYGASGVIDKVDRFLFDKPLLLIGEDGANLVNRSTPIAFIARGKYWVNNHAHVIDFYSDVLMEYICNYINAISLIDYVTGTAQPKMNQEKMNSILVALPPNEEQTRINQKIESILPLVYKYDKQKKSLDNLNNELYHTLHKSILQEAIQGRLVPQLLEEGTAQELLEQIRLEKQQLIKEGKLKKSALTDSVIYKSDDNKYYEQVGKENKEITEEILFDLPDKWQWCRIGTVFMHNNGKQLNKGNTKGKLMKYITTSNLYWDGFVLDNLKEMPFEENEIERCMAVKGDLLVCEGGDIGRSCIWNYDFPIMLQNHIHKLRPYIPICTKFFYYIFNLYNLTGLIGGKGIGIQGFSSKALHNTLVPLPPLKEQHRIVAQIEKLFEQLR